MTKTAKQPPPISKEMPYECFSCPCCSRIFLGGERVPYHRDYLTGNPCTGVGCPSAALAFGATGELPWAAALAPGGDPFGSPAPRRRPTARAQGGETGRPEASLP